MFCLAADGAFSTEEHVVPRMLGPDTDRFVIAPGTVCDDCNTWLGRQVDAPSGDRFDMRLSRGLETTPPAQGQRPAHDRRPRRNGPRDRGTRRAAGHDRRSPRGSHTQRRARARDPAPYARSPRHRCPHHPRPLKDRRRCGMAESKGRSTRSKIRPAPARRPWGTLQGLSPAGTVHRACDAALGDRRQRRPPPRPMGHGLRARRRRPGRSSRRGRRCAAPRRSAPRLGPAPHHGRSADGGSICGSNPTGSSHLPRVGPGGWPLQYRKRPAAQLPPRRRVPAAAVWTFSRSVRALRDSSCRRRTYALRRLRTARAVLFLCPSRRRRRLVRVVKTRPPSSLAPMWWRVPPARSRPTRSARGGLSSCRYQCQRRARWP